MESASKQAALDAVELSVETRENNNYDEFGNGYNTVPLKQFHMKNSETNLLKLTTKADVIIRSNKSPQKKSSRAVVSSSG